MTSPAWPQRSKSRRLLPVLPIPFLRWSRTRKTSRSLLWRKGCCISTVARQERVQFLESRTARLIIVGGGCATMRRQTESILKPVSTGSHGQASATMASASQSRRFAWKSVRAQAPWSHRLCQHSSTISRLHGPESSVWCGISRSSGRCCARVRVRAGLLLKFLFRIGTAPWQ